MITEIGFYIVAAGWFVLWLATWVRDGILDMDYLILAFLNYLIALHMKREEGNAKARRWVA